MRISARMPYCIDWTVETRFIAVLNFYGLHSGCFDFYLVFRSLILEFGVCPATGHFGVAHREINFRSLAVLCILWCSITGLKRAQLPVTLEKC